MPELVKRSVNEILEDYINQGAIWHNNAVIELSIEQAYCLMRKAQAEIHKRYQWNKEYILLGTGVKIYNNEPWTTLDELMEEI